MSSTDNKLVKTITDASILVGLSAGIGWIGRKILKEPFVSDPSSNIMNYAKWVAVMAISIYAKDYLIEKKIIPDKM